MRILITGINSKIGNAFEKYIMDNAPTDVYTIEKVSLRKGMPSEETLCRNDVIIHAAGISKTDTHAISEGEKEQYFHVNRDLTLELAGLAKKCGVKQFILLSTMMVYGNPALFDDHFDIDKETVPAPLCVYGKSKLEAEKVLELSDESFVVSVIREPVVYGPSFNGEIAKLARIAKHIPIFPKLECRKSIIHQHNLIELIKQIIDTKRQGIVCPQDREVLSVSQLYSRMARNCGKKVYLIPGLKGLLSPLSRLVDPIKTICSDMSYTTENSIIEGLEYQIYSIDDLWKE